MKFGFKNASIVILTCGLFACGGGGGSDPTPPPPPNNTAPVANAGVDQTADTGSVITLTGAASADVNNDSLTYAWSFTSLPTDSIAAFSSATVVSPTFTADLDGSYVVQLIVNDGIVNSSANSVTIDASTPNSAPVANAGTNQNTITGSVVTLDGSLSADADADNITYLWELTLPTGSSGSASLDDATSPTPKFTADQDGTYIAELTVNDGTVDSAVDSVEIVSATANSAPTANAGIDQNVVISTLVTLDGSDSTDANGDPLTYLWSLTSAPAGNTAVLANETTEMPSFTPDVEGTYTVQLLVNDATVSSTADTVDIVVAIANSAPVAEAGDKQVVKTAVAVTLDGSASTDANGDLLSYTWAFVSIPMGSVAEFTDSQIVNPMFTTDVDGSYVISLVVSDSMVSSVADTVQIIVSDTDIVLSKKEGTFGNTFNEVPFPYDETININIELIGPSFVTLDTFRLTAQGGDLTIINIQAINETNALVPSITGITEGMVLSDGVTTEFALTSPFTEGEVIQLRYSFEIEETGQIFSSDYVLTSN
ncbi:MAG: hypothetical protein ACJAVV_003758 [Alphaproteobacteria bacterium]|jgi:hypothetical protein